MRKMTIDKDHHLIGKVTFFHLGIIIISCFVVHSQGMLAAEFREIEAALNKKSSNTERNKETPKGKRENHSRKFSILKSQSSQCPNDPPSINNKIKRNTCRFFFH